MRPWVLVVVAGCYAPDVATGVPCTDQHTCPDRQICDLATNRCERTVGPGADGGDVPDGMSCAPNEVLVDGACVIPLAEVAASPVSPAGCDVEDANNTRPVAIDRANRIYVGFRCAMNEVFVAVSTDGGASAAPPVSLGVVNVDHVSMVGTTPGHAYLAAAGTDGVVFARTSDGGATWTKTPLDPDRPDPGWGISIATLGTSVYVAVRVNGSTTRVWRNAADGAGAFDVLDVAFGTAFGDLLVDPATGDVWLAGDTPSLHLRRSTDGGASFGAQIDVPASYNFSDWSLGGAAIFVTGTSNDTFTRIPLSAPTMPVEVMAMLPNAGGRDRAIVVAPDEAVYIANRSSGDVSTMLRFAPGSASGVARTLADARAPHFVVGPSKAMPYAYTNSSTNRVELGVFVY